MMNWSIPSTSAWKTSVFVRTKTAAILAICILSSLATANSQDVTEQKSIFSHEDDAQLLDWPFLDNGFREDEVYFIREERVGNDCFKECFEPRQAVADQRRHPTQHPADSDHAAAFENEAGFLGEDDEDVGEDGLLHDGATNEAMWHCEHRCGILEPIQVDKVLHLFDKNAHGRYLILWESRAFADAEHTREALQELAKVAGDLRKQKNSPLRPILYTYSGWHPNAETVVSWWRDQHSPEARRRPWQSTPDSFGGWGRATMSLVEDGKILWDVFDIVHSSKHWRLLHDFDFGNEEVLQQLDPFGVAGDLAGALQYVLQNLDSEHFRLPLQVCLQVARIVLGPRFKQDLAHGKNEQHMDALAEYCEDLQDEERENLASHRADIDYERFALMAKQMGVVDPQGSMWKHTLTTWRSVLAYLRSDRQHKSKRIEARKPSDIVIMASIVPVYDGGIEAELGVGDRHEALMLSLCYRNYSIPEGATEDRYATSGKRVKAHINTDVFLAVVPCEDLTSHDVLECLKGILADARAGSLDVETGDPFYSIAGFIFGVGFVGKTEYLNLQPYWSADPAIPGQGEFPPDEVTEKYASEHQRRNRKPSKIIYKDEL